MFDLNESPPPVVVSPPPVVVPVPVVSPGERNGGLRVCGSCRKLAEEVEGEMLVCVRCGKCFHMKCMGTKQKAVGDWRCFGCLFAGSNAGASGSGSSSNAERGRAGGAGILDMNAPPPPEDEEVQFLGARSAGVAALGIYLQPEQYDRRYIIYIIIWM